MRTGGRELGEIRPAIINTGNVVLNSCVKHETED